MVRERPGRVRSEREKRKVAMAENAPPFARLLLLSRLVLVLIPQVLLNWAVPDHAADAFRSLGTAPRSAGDRVVVFLLGGFGNWDARHFLHIAEFGYTYETNLAFFPLFPLLCRLVTGQWLGLLPPGTLQPHFALLATAAVLNLGAFFVAGYVLHQLTLNYFGDRRMAATSVVLFAVNPASVFFSAAYSEAFFAMFTFLGLELLSGGAGPLSASRALGSSVVLGLALLTRANGLLNVGFLGFALGGPWLIRLIQGPRNPTFLVGRVVLGLAALATLLGPYAFHQWAVFRDFCSPNPPYMAKAVQLLGRDEDLVMPGMVERMPWCSRLIPISYAYIQAQYWDVGFLGYFQLRKLPLFLLASPTIITAFYGAVHFGAIQSALTNPLSATLQDRKSLLPFTLHIVALTITGMFFANVEVTTRILFSSSPFMYWTLGSLLPIQELDSQLLTSGNLWQILQRCWTHGTLSSRLVISFCLGYTLIGTALHVNFYPWT